MTARLEFLLGLVALVVAGLALTTLYLRVEVRRRATAGESERQPEIGVPSL